MKLTIFGPIKFFNGQPPRVVKFGKLNPKIKEKFWDDVLG